MGFPLSTEPRYRGFTSRRMPPDPRLLVPRTGGANGSGRSVASLRTAARLLAAYGQGQDTILAHISPEEAWLLHALGGAGTRNPWTGLPQFSDEPASAGSVDDTEHGESVLPVAGLVSPNAQAGAQGAVANDLLTRFYNDFLALPVNDIRRLFDNPSEIPDAIASVAPGIAPIAAELPRAISGAIGGMRAWESPAGVPKATDNSANSFGIPEDYVLQPPKKGDGIKYVDPNNPHNYVRVMRGEPTSSFEAQRNPYVIDMRSGQPIDIEGSPVSSSSPDAHIPQSQYRYRP